MRRARCHVNGHWADPCGLRTAARARRCTFICLLSFPCRFALGLLSLGLFRRTSGCGCLGGFQGVFGFFNRHRLNAHPDIHSLRGRFAGSWRRRIPHLNCRCDYRRHWRWVPAHAALAPGALASGAMFGTMSRSVAANVYGTRALTIPTIKRRSFAPEFAGGVEAAASCRSHVL
jgi:hypothetical protein